MNRRRPSRTAGSVVTAGVAILGVALIGFVGVVIGDGGASIESAVAATQSTLAANALTEEVVSLAVGGVLLGLGIGVVVASSATYWYQNKQIGGRLE